jgi:serine/threonine protein kinase
MGEVFLGLSPDSELVAVKVIDPKLAGQDGQFDKDYRKRFAREVEAARRVSSEFTARVIDADPGAEKPWLATAYVKGPTFVQRVKERGPLSPEQVLTLAENLATGLSHIHAAGFVHRDLKPLNIIMVGTKPVIIDFGIARAIDRTQITAPGSVLGTRGYMSPEQESGIGEVGPASDVYSLGMTLIYAATGEAPFTPRLDRVPDWLRPMISACVAQAPGERPTPLGIIEKVRAIRQQPFAPVPVPSPRPGAPPVNERRGDGGAAAAVNLPRNGLLVKVMTLPSTPLPPPPFSLVGRFKTSSEFRIQAATVGVLIVALCATFMTFFVHQQIQAYEYRHDPVLRPTGLTSAYTGPDMVGFAWAPPTSGPQPDSYEVLEDGKLVHHLSGSQTSYIQRGLTRGTSRAFQVIAIRDGKSSKPSADLSMAPGLPTSTTLNWSGTVTDKATSVQPADPGFMDTGQDFADAWTLTDKCSAGACKTVLSGAVNGDSFSSDLMSSGFLYTGNTTMDYGYCGKDSSVFAVHVQVRILSAQMQGGTWRVYTWTGTVTMTSTDDGCTGETMTLMVSS